MTCCLEDIRSFSFLHNQSGLKMMKTRNFFLTMLAVVIAGVVGLVACEKSANKIPLEDRSVIAGITSTCGLAGMCGDSMIAGVITADLHLKTCIEYQLRGLVYVSNNATLTIEPGTRIVGLLGSGGSESLGGGLIVTRGAKIIADGLLADGTVCPIVFTSANWNNNPQPGDWSGVSILGRAPINKTNPLLEGVGGSPAGDARYGGDNCSDSSGLLRYVRIEYAGYELSTDNELNGLTLAGVGCRTMIDHVEVYKARDDAFAFFGGTVNCTHLVAVDAQDDLFDATFGYSGRIQYALGLSDPDRADKSQSNGIESENDNVSPNPATPQTLAMISNLTIIGQADSSLGVRTNMPPSGLFSATYGRAAHIRRNSGFVVANSIFMGFKWGISLDGTASQNKLLVDGISCFRNNLVQAFVTPFKTENAAGTWAPLAGTGNVGYASFDANTDILLTDPFNRYVQDFALPQLTSPAVGATFNAGCFSGGCCGFTYTTNSFKGAFGSENWAQDLNLGGWVRYYE
jgi:hypothetical protein